jgi:ribose 5-phosphate isomerase B
MLKYIVSDHAGRELKNKILKNHPYLIDLSPENNDADDYPDFAKKLLKSLALDPKNEGIAICGSGQGICMSLNRSKKIRACLILNKEQVKSCREHNNSNVICFSQNFTNESEINEILDIFNNTKFSKLERHNRRINKIS